MTSTKCDQTGHFFGYYPEHDIGFTCFECLEEFGASGRRPANPWAYSSGGLGRESRKRRSLHLAPPSSNVPEEPVVVSERDEKGRLRSKPWRCLQQRCKLLVCDKCSDLLINPEYVSQSRDRDPNELIGKRNSMVGSDMIARAGAATPPEQRASRELRASTHEPLMITDVPEIDDNMESPAAESDDEAALDALRSKLVYRRAGNVATSALAHFHHRDSRSGRGPPIPNRAPVKEPPHVREEVKRPANIIPDHLVSTGSGPQMPLEVDSKEESENEEEELMPKLTVRSAAQAANHAMRSAHWRERAADLAATSRVGKV